MCYIYTVVYYIQSLQLFTIMFFMRVAFVRFVNIHSDGKIVALAIGTKKANGHDFRTLEVLYSCQRSIWRSELRNDTRSLKGNCKFKKSARSKKESKQ